MNKNKVYMSSKYIKNSRIANSEMWYSFTTPDNSKEKEEDRLWKEKQLIEKSRLESIPLEQLSFKDLYELPFHQAKYGSWVYDVKSNFIFQFEFKGDDTRKKVINILNGDLLEYKRQVVEHKNGVIYVDENPFIMIRGWGNLTGVGAYNLDGDLDLILPYYQLLEKEGFSVVEDLEDRPSGSDYGETILINGVKADIRIDPSLKYKVLDYKGYPYKVVPLETIIEAKARYAKSKWGKKHKEDLNEMILNKNK